jgi:GH24 family phage-related lysozyme (muramidase)
MAQLTIDSFQKFIKSSENKQGKVIRHFYCDGNKGDNSLVNIGYGFHHKNWHGFKNMFEKNSVSFKWKDTRRGALGMKEIQNEFEMIKKARAGVHTAATLSNMLADEAGLERIFQSIYSNIETEAAKWYNNSADVEKNLTSATIKYEKWDSLPANARYAIIDMAYNGGIGLVSKFKKLKIAMKKGDFMTAALECRFREYPNMGGVTTRNNYRSNLMIDCASLEDKISFRLKTSQIA